MTKVFVHGAAECPGCFNIRIPRKVTIVPFPVAGKVKKIISCPVCGTVESVRVVSKTAPATISARLRPRKS